ncbi:hypothetical protein TL16_g11078 [Triparma laevis f. inornata]|uniref:Uncharacterized protein n=1 Tax=Triparma laevis f. inornata TaxID=1714386 RepID=A0A9W7BBY0_9STRA|nr:hypothetical protein TL16_g11078 [Triparma laevis f. inornata]
MKKQPAPTKDQPSRKGSLTIERIQSALSSSSKRVEAEALARGFKVYKTASVPPEQCPEFNSETLQTPVSILSCFQRSKRVSSDLETLKKKHEDDYNISVDKFQAMVLDNEEEGYTTISEEAFLELGKEEIGWTGTHGMEVGMGMGLSKAQEELRRRIPKDSDSSGRVYPGTWLGNPGHLAKEARPVGAESYGGREESIVFDKDATSNANDRGSYGQRARSVEHHQPTHPQQQPDPLSLVLSQILPGALGDAHHAWSEVIAVLTMTCLSFIMINVGYEFDIDKAHVSKYISDYLIAMTAAGFPWIFVAFWFVYVVPEPLPWGDSLLAARFAAPTSAGILFSMLEAAGMKETWLFSKARVLAIFDDLDTVLLMIPLKVVLVGFKWELSLELLVVIGLLVLAWKKLHDVRIPCSWDYTILYSLIIAGVCEIIAFASAHDGVPMEAVHLEVLMPAFVIGCIARNPHLDEAENIHDIEKARASLQPLTKEEEEEEHVTSFEKKRAEMANAAPGALFLRRGDEGGDRPPMPHSRQSVRVLQEAKQEWASEERVNDIISACFMILVGLSMPELFGGDNCDSAGGGHRRMMGSGLASGALKKLAGMEDTQEYTDSDFEIASSEQNARFLSGDEDEESHDLSVGQLAFHVICVSLLMVAGKMFPICCYKDEANVRTRLALALGMCPRGEVGAGVIVISIAFGICGQCITIAVMCLALNLIASSFFIMAVKSLVDAAELDDTQHGIKRDTSTGEIIPDTSKHDYDKAPAQPKGEPTAERTLTEFEGDSRL